MKWIIEDWMSKRCYPDKEFNSFEEAREFINEIARDEAYKKYPNNEALREELEDGINDDLYAIEQTEED